MSVNEKHYCPMKSNERAMERWPLIRTILKNSPTMKTGDLVDALRGKVSRSDVFSFLDIYENEGMIHRPIRGCVMLVRKPSVWDGFFSVLRSGFGLFDWWERRAKRELFERERALRRLEMEKEMLLEEMSCDEDEFTFDKDREIKRKYEKEYGFDSPVPERE